MNTSDEVLVAEQLYAAGDDKGLLDHAQRVWDQLGSSASASAEVARFARVAAFRSKSPEDDLWQARAVAAATVSGCWRSLALSLQQYFFRLLGAGQIPAAEAVLEEMERLAANNHDGAPTQDLADGILAERRGLLLTAREEWPAAADSYEKALSLCPIEEGRPPERRHFKVRGGLARSKWLAGGTDDEAAAEFETLAAEGEAFPDVRTAALANLAAARSGDRSASVPFDLV